MFVVSSSARSVCTPEDEEETFPGSRKHSSFSEDEARTKGAKVFLKRKKVSSLLVISFFRFFAFPSVVVLVKEFTLRVYVQPDVGADVIGTFFLLCRCGKQVFVFLSLVSSFPLFPSFLPLSVHV